MSHSSKGAIYMAAAANLLIAVAKFGGAAVTGSAAMMSEGIHSLVDTGNQGLLLLGIRLSNKQPDKQHPLGYGKETYFWSFLVAVMIFGLGAGVSIWEGVDKIIHPHALDIHMVASIGGFDVMTYHVVLSILVVAMLLEGLAFRTAYRAFVTQHPDTPVLKAIHDTKDPTVIVILFEDSAAMLGLIVAFFGISAAYVLDMPLLDGIASVAIGVILAVTAFFLAVECKGLLIGESATAETRSKITAMVNAIPGIKRANEIITLHQGPQSLMVCISVDFQDNISSNQIEATVSQVEADIRSTIPGVAKVFIEAQNWRSHQELLAQ
ncbi:MULTISPECIES: cation diffusion facilitator family transporter [Thalassospira]|jgi:cation diffusion facilitator family transporter|uniref:Cation transporter n=2 Tax=Thalassospira TaxID=168934 RepID=A0ABR5XV89_9PROT|nr:MULTISPECIES: cation diffusion facilitator family transporter [Thalassospira]MBR9780285.1 cation diffusion facilitator family transporter [Rhodospirillales bacterium]KZC96625.1 cation transporter [Thalassospira xiamenensis]KZD10541.1 cation transporter [Thalassospira xiamenensis]MAB33242.1 cation transporter [Thalassospira sp.]MBL4840636.1 cation diffusion facilitator family transporter [Thalassospira sp.]|tara:strand:+ start:1247 stop:2215 length:969 start_codon:yes stop_codon:yes gene_type:complete